MGTKQRDHVLVHATDRKAHTKTESHRRQQQIVVSDAHLAVEWLNARRGTREYRRVLRIRNELIETGKMFDALKGREPIPSPPEFTKRAADGTYVVSSPEKCLVWFKRHDDFRQLFDDFKRRDAALNKTLGRYSFRVLRVFDVRSGNKGWNAVSRQASCSPVGIALGDSVVQIDEASVVNVLVRLDAVDELHRVCLCAKCKETWKVQLREMDKFCSRGCREAFRRDDPASRARHAHHQAKYRERENARNHANSERWKREI